jgi:SAM-dependent methyltransferase
MTREWWGPAGYDWLLAASEARGLAARRRRLIGSAHGRVLEVGAGTGLNLRHYRPELVSSILALEPDRAMGERLERRAAAITVPCQWQPVAVEQADMPDESFDTVVVTLTLCTVADPAGAVAAMARWLVPGGRLLFIEHVAARGIRGRLQRAVGPLWSVLAGGCHLDRDTLATLRQAGLSVSDCDRFALPAGGPLLSSCVAGVAWRPPIGLPSP